MWLPCNWKIPIDNFNEIYHLPTVHMHIPKVHMQNDTGADRSKQLTMLVASHYSDTRIDLSDEGHNRMLLKGSYGVGSTDKEGNIIAKNLHGDELREAIESLL